MMQQEEKQAIKDYLIDRQDKLIEQMQGFSDSWASYRESLGELSNYDNHPADEATGMYDRSKDRAIHEAKEEELEAINKALHAMEDGTYGICRICGKDIEDDRLKALPETDVCLQHAETDMHEQLRPVEERVIPPQLNPDRLINDSGYDREDAWQDVGQYGTSESPSDFYGDKEDYGEMYPNSENREKSDNYDSFM